MTDEIPAPSATPPAPEPPASPAPAPAAPEFAPIPFNIGEEFGTSKKNLPPVKVVLIVVGVIAVVAAIAAFLLRPKSSGTGSLDDVVGVEVPGQNSVMVAMNVTIANRSKGTLKIHDVKAELDTGGSQYTDEPAAAVDFARYFQALPDLKQHALQPFNIEQQIAPGEESKSTIIVSFPVTADAFKNRKSLTVSIYPYGDTVPLVLSK